MIASSCSVGLSYSVKLCHVVSCSVMQCCSVMSYSVSQCHLGQCNAMYCHLVSFSGISCILLFLSVMLYQTVPGSVQKRHAVSYVAISRQIESDNVMQYCVTPCRNMQYCAVLCGISELYGEIRQLAINLVKCLNEDIG